MDKLARFAVRKRWWIVLGWVGLIVVLQALASAAGGSDFKNDFKLPHTETATVSNLLAKAKLGAQNGATGTVVLHAKSGKVADFDSQVQPALQKLCTEDYGVSTIVSPFGTIDCTAPAGATQTPSAAAKAQEAALTSQDGTIGLVNISWTSQNPDPKKVKSLADELSKLETSNPQLQVEFTGNAFQALSFAKSSFLPELVGFAAALIILSIVFRTVGATVLPLASAVAALGSGTAITSLLTHSMAVADFATQLQTLMVLGVGIDYALFIVTRHRRNLTRGMSVEDSIAASINTSGRAVLFAGTTVCIAILGLLLLGVSFLYGVALATAIGVALTMIASLTLLPALLGFLGLKVLPRKARAAVRDGQFQEGPHEGFWYRWSGFVERNPLKLALAAFVLIGALAIPFFSMQLGNSDQGSDPAGSTTRVGYDLIAQGFGPGYNSVLELVVTGPQATDPAYLAKITTTLKVESTVAPDSVQTIPLGKDVALISFKTTTSPQDLKTTDLVKNLRSEILPPLYEGTQNHIYVYGITAIYVDFAKVLASKMPLFFAAVIGLSFLLLMVAFRSLVVPLTAAAMNLLAAAAAFGIVVAIFQWGWFSDALAVGKGGPIEPFLPVMFFAILFGLSMDYQVFLVSRMHEEWVHTKDNRRAITVGQAETGGIITAAALIMIAVFGGFILGDGRIIKLFGFGLASAVFLDAFVLRTVLVPSLMHMFGRANWYFPKWLDRVVPQLSVEPPDEEPSDTEKEPVPV
ncbi:putative drug exporter of the RND superfamily [Frankineae bacterium MT45]|nr:putative drug exporter of the RND superfamily [Frankineae bacterium MT45]